VNIVDAIMGVGKSEAGIQKMKEDVDSRYIFITPFLREVERIVNNCSERNFNEPKNLGEGKLSDLHNLLFMKRNVASTHSLFKLYNEETIDLIKRGNYKLILDEVFGVLELVKITNNDIKTIFKSKLAKVDKNGIVHWIDKDYKGHYEYIKLMAENKSLLLIKDSFLVWEFPIEMFKCFEEVTILTYMFESQLQRYYYDIHGIEYNFMGVKKENGVYRFSDEPNDDREYIDEIKNKIHIFDDEKINSIGADKNSLSVSWYEKEFAKKGKPQLKQLKNNIYNVLRNIYDSKSDEIMWTTYKDYRVFLAGKGYKKGFVPVNSRSTNMHNNKKDLAYCANIFMNPYLKLYLSSRGLKVDSDKYALSEMIQWIWRSAIREGENINIYIPSVRMRLLLKDWLHGL